MGNAYAEAGHVRLFADAHARRRRPRAAGDVSQGEGSGSCTLDTLCVPDRMFESGRGYPRCWIRASGDCRDSGASEGTWTAWAGGRQRPVPHREGRGRAWHSQACPRIGATVPIMICRTEYVRDIPERVRFFCGGGIEVQGSAVGSFENGKMEPAHKPSPRFVKPCNGPKVSRMRRPSSRKAGIQNSVTSQPSDLQNRRAFKCSSPAT